jgi:Protein of unknown function (DUF2950)
MFDFVGEHRYYDGRILWLAVSVAMLLPLAACNKQGASTAQTGPQTFRSPEDAGKALADAAKSQNQDELQQIFGPGSSDIISSGDATDDKASLNGFAQAYQVMNRWRTLSNGSEALIVGADNQAFPVPLRKNATGQWYFDTAAGKEESLSRRIGRDEITAISVITAAVDAQHEYFAQRHQGVNQYAQKFISDPGKENGLYWPEVQGQPKSPLGPLVAYATAEGYKVQADKHQPFYGYYFAMFDKQGAGAPGGAKDYVVDGKMTRGFAVVAYPAAYGDSGVMTFLVDQNGMVLQKDLGKTTDQIASAMTEFNPDKTWTVVE